MGDPVAEKTGERPEQIGHSARNRKSLCCLAGPSSGQSILNLLFCDTEDVPLCAQVFRFAPETWRYDSTQARTSQPLPALETFVKSPYVIECDTLLYMLALDGDLNGRTC